MNPKALIPLIAGLGIAGLAGKLGWDQLRAAQGAPTKTVQLWAPVQDIPRGTAITESMLQPMAFPMDLAPKDAIARKETLLGRVPHTGAPADLPILNSMLLPPGAQPGVYVPPGLRAVAVKIDESSGVDNHLVPGCRVDVIGYFNTRRGNNAEIIARTLIENTEVAAVGSRLSPDAPEQAAQGGRRTRTDRARAVTLLVKPDQVPVLHLAEQRGRIKLSMRGEQESDTAAVSRSRATESDILGLDDDGSSGEQAGDGPLGGFLANLFKQFAGAPEEPAQSAPPAPALPAQQPPALAWTMVIYNGDERCVVGWDSLTSMTPREVRLDGPNVFQNPPSQPFPPSHPNPPIQPLPPVQFEPPRSELPPLPPPAGRPPRLIDPPDPNGFGSDNEFEPQEFRPEPQELFE